jgi:Ca-activated chloride channel family protein
MRKIVFSLLLPCVLSVAIFAQSDNTRRPRVVTGSTPESRQTTPPVLQNDQQTQNSTKKPPVLTGGGVRPTSSVEVPVRKDDEDGVVKDDEVIKVETNLVTMPVSVLDRDGRFVGGLQQKDFKVFENGVEQKVEYFQSVEKPFTVVLLIDVSPSTQYKIDEIQDAAIAFINQLRKEDRVAVISFDEHVHLLASPTNNKNTLRNAIEQLQFGDGTSLYEAVENVVSQYLKRIDGRKAVVLFTDGVDTTSRRASYQSTIADVQELDALFYTIRYDTSGDMNGGWGGGAGGSQRRGGNNGGLGDVIGIILGGGRYPGGGGRGSRRQGSSREEYEEGRKYLEALAQNSGGRSFEAPTISNLDAAFSGIAEELRRQYSIGYYPESVGTAGERRQIRVRVARPNLVIRAKSSYIVGQNDKHFAGK